MNSFSRAYRDKRSPLAPITPLSVNNVFSFRLGGDDSLKPYVEQVDANRKREACYANQNAVVKANVQCKPAPAKPNKCACRAVPQAQGTVKQIKPAAQCCRRVLPRAGDQQRPLYCPADPRLSALLLEAGMDKYVKLFAQAQVDYQAFRTLSLTDLIRLGVKSYGDCKCLLYAIDKANNRNS